MEFFDGKSHAVGLDLLIKDFLSSNSNLNIKPLLIIQVGTNASSEKYIALKKKIGESLGVVVEIKLLDAALSDDEAIHTVHSYIGSHSFKSIIIQLPLPRKSLSTLLDLIPLHMDVDMLSSDVQELFYRTVLINEDCSFMISPVVRAVDYFIKNTGLTNDDQMLTAAVIGNGFLVGAPIAHYLKSTLGFDVTVLTNYKSGDVLDFDLVISGAGIPNLIKGACIKEHAYVIDFGSTVVNGKLVGDLDLNSELEHLGLVSASPGGLGPLVVRFLFMNHLGL